MIASLFQQNTNMVIRDHEDLTSALNGEKCRIMIRRKPYEWEMVFVNELIQRVIRLNGYTHIYVGDNQEKTEIIEIKNDELFFMFIGENVV